MTIRRDCGSCNLCCTLLGVPDINKPARMTCWWTTVHGGCQRQGEKATDPALTACAQFECVWLESQKLDEAKVMPRMWRPDMTGVVLGPKDRDDETLLFVQVDPSRPTAWREEPILSLLNGILDRGGKLEIIVGETHLRLPVV